MVLSGIEERMAAALKDESGARDKVRDVAAFVGLHGPEILVAYAVLNIELLGDLKGIRNVGVERVNVHEALWVPHGDGRSRHIASRKVGQGTERRICGRPSASRAATPASLSSVEGTSSSTSSGLVILIVALSHI